MRILTGRVVNNVDPENLGRVVVALDQFNGRPETPWLKVMQPLASSSVGVVCLPEPQDLVLVAALDGSPSA